MFAKGAGRIGNYENCAWQVLGRGQFRPVTGSNPFIGQQDQLAFVDEYQVEMVCEDHLVKDVIIAMKQNHPYEEPAYAIWQITTCL